MSLPELRRLQCDRILLNEETPLPSERCGTCGKLMKLEIADSGKTPAPPPAAALSPDFDDLPEAVPVVRSATQPVPVVQPKADPPLVRPPAPKVPMVAPPPAADHWPELDTPPPPKPRYGCALLIVLAFAALSLVAVTFIVYAIARGLRKAPKTEPTPTKVVEATPTGITEPTKTNVIPQKPAPAGASLWQPPTGAFPLKSTIADNTRVIALPGPATYGVSAGNGRFVLYPCVSAQLIAVVDVSLVAIAGYIPLPDANPVLVAGDSQSAFVWTAQTLERYDLVTLRRKAAVKIGSFCGNVKAIAAGIGVRGPLYVLGTAGANDPRAKLFLLDPETLAELPWNAEIPPFKKPNGVFTGALKADTAYLRASANGRVLYGGVAIGEQNYRVDKLELFGTSPAITPVSISQRRPSFPTADGGASAFESEPRTTRYAMTEGHGYFEFAEKAGGTVLTMFFVGEGRVQRAELKGLDDFEPGDDADKDRRAVLVPSSQALLYLRTGSTSVAWRRVKIGDELPKLTQDYLVISSTPTPWAVRGKTYEYDPKFLTGSGAANIKIETAPPGLKLDRGKLVWPVPTDAPEGDTLVEIALESKLKPEVSQKQRFALRILDAEPKFSAWPAPVLPPPRNAITVRSTKPSDDLEFAPLRSVSVSRGQTAKLSFTLTTPEDAEVALLAAPPGAKLEKGELVWTADAPGRYPVVLSATLKNGTTASVGTVIIVE